MKNHEFNKKLLYSLMNNDISENIVNIVLSDPRLRNVLIKEIFANKEFKDYLANFVYKLPKIEVKI